MSKETPAVRSEEWWSEVLETVLGNTFLTVQRAMEYHGAGDPDGLLEECEERMANANIEECPECALFVESSELVDDDLNEVSCENCRR